MLIVEIVIQFHYPVVAVARARHRSEIVVQIRWQIRDRARPQSRKQRRRQRALRYSKRRKQRFRVGHPRRRGLGGLACESKDVVLFFKPYKEERLVLDDGSADRKPIVFIPQARSFRKFRTCYKER